MKTSIPRRPCLILAAVAALASADAIAQSASLRGAGLFALSANDLTGASTLVEMDDGGGGSRILRGVDGADSSRPSAPASEAPVQPAPDALPPPVIPAGDPATQVAPTPRRPNYRWQSLVPGAIK